MEYNFLKAIEELIEKCKKSDSRVVLQKKDDKGNVVLWLEGGWVVPDSHIDCEVVKVCFCNNKTGEIMYSKYIDETMTKMDMN